MSGVTVEGNDWHEVRARIGLGVKPDRRSMIEVDLWQDFNNDRSDPQLFQVRSAYGDTSFSKARLTRRQVEAEIKRVLDFHFARLAKVERQKADVEHKTKQAALHDARKRLAETKKHIKRLMKGGA